MDFIIIANAWSSGKDNPICCHRIAVELIGRGNRVLWIEGSGMRTPSLRSSRDRARIARKVVSSLRGARREGTTDHRLQTTDQNQAEADASRSDVYGLMSMVSLSSLWVLSPLFIPLPKHEFIRRLNGLICRANMRFWGWRLGFRDPVLINYVPVLAEAMRCRRRRQTSDHRPQTIDRSGAQVAAENRNQSEAHPSSKSDVCGMPAVALAKEGLRSEVSRCAPRIVYHCVDRWDAYPNYDSCVMTEMDRRCCELADLVLASSRFLAGRCRLHNANARLLCHGVDYDHFARALQATASSLPDNGRLTGTVRPANRQFEGVARPADLPAGRIAGFFGLFSAWLDQDLLVDVARRVPECEIVLIGRPDVSVDRLRGIRNVHLLGPRPFSQLPGYIAHFDVGLIPYVVNDFTMAVNPTKLREMLAAGCPVVSTDLPEVRAYVGRGVVAADSVGSFAAAVAERIRNPATPAERIQISNGVAGETWAVKVDEMMGYLCPVATA